MKMCPPSSAFGDEWQRFGQQGMVHEEAEQMFGDDCVIFPGNQLPFLAEWVHMGCSSGRWAGVAAQRVCRLHCMDSYSSLAVARLNLAAQPHVLFHQASVAAIGLPWNRQGFGYSLGVLYHVPSTAAAIRSCTDLLKPCAPILLYLYYAFDIRPRWFRWRWRLSNVARLSICRLPSRFMQRVPDMIAFTIYWPLARLAAFAEAADLPVASFPLSSYSHCSVCTMRINARDRFGTPLEQRFSCFSINQICTDAGLVNLQFSTPAPYWCVAAFKAG